MGITGADPHGDRLVRLLGTSGIDTAGVQQDAAGFTTVKTRIIARHQQVVRVDRERHAPLHAEQEARAMRHLDSIVESLDGMVISDYGKGFVSQPLADRICALARRPRQDPDGGSAPSPCTLLAWRHGHQAQSRRSVSGRRPATGGTVGTAARG